MKIKLTHGYFTIIDDDDFNKISNYTWRIQDPKRKLKYVVTTKHRHKRDGGSQTLYLHRLIMNPPKGLVVDHIDGNPLDNRKSNLRICSTRMNLANTRDVSPVSKYKGVMKHSKNTWMARIAHDYIGNFSSPDDAARAYDKEAIKRYGEFAATNKKLGLLE